MVPLDVYDRRSDHSALLRCLRRRVASIKITCRSPSWWPSGKLRADTLGGKTMESRRLVNVKAILADADLRRKLMVSTIQATQAREGIDTTRRASRSGLLRGDRRLSARLFFDLEPFRATSSGVVERRRRDCVRTVRCVGRPGQDPRTKTFLAQRLRDSIEGSLLAVSHTIASPSWRR
jgi:hypothetical protein